MELKKKRTVMRFVKGARLPAEYQEVEYIQRAGAPQTNNCYIKTGVNSGASLKIEVEVETNNNDNLHYIIFGAYFGAQIKTYNDNYYIDDISKGKITVDGKILFEGGIDSSGKRYLTYQDISFTSGSNSRTYEVYLFTLNGAYSGGQGAKDDNGTTKDLVAQYNGKLYSCKMSLSGELVRDFVPCYRKADMEIGLYDLVTNTFYSNDGTGTFTKGQDV